MRVGYIRHKFYTLVMPLTRSLWRIVPALLLPLLLLGEARVQPTVRPIVSHGSSPLEALRRAACESPSLGTLAAVSGREPCSGGDLAQATSGPRAAVASLRPFAAVPAAEGDGMLIDRLRVLTIGNVALDLVAYLSSGLVVGGLLCYVDDGQPRSTVIHLHGGLGGIFINPDGGDTVGTCYRWAAASDRNAFVPSFRGQDGGQGTPELCLGEADDVAAAAILLRGLDIVDPDRMALIGGSMGGCVALRAGTRIPNLRAVVAIAPPTDWKSFANFHRGPYQSAVETRCDGSTLDWNQGGPVFADTIDGIICGHPVCSDAEYDVRSPIAEVADSTNPTLVLVAGADNLVPTEQQLLWPALRNVLGGQVDVEVRERCSAAAALPLGQDVLLYVPGAYHLMEDGPIISGLIYLSELLDAAGAPAGPVL